MLGHLQKPANPNATLFYDYAAHFVDEKWWAPNCPDKVTAELWSVLYEEVWYCQYDTTQLPRIWNFYENALKHGKDTAAIGLIDFSFNRLKSDALTSDKYFLADDNDNLVDNFKFTFLGDPQVDDPDDTTLYGVDPANVQQPTYRNSTGESPYLHDEVFSANVFKEKFLYKNVTFKIDPNLLFIGAEQLTDYVVDFSLRIDFGDGNGWQIVDHTQSSFETINYNSNGTKSLKVGLFDVGGTKLRESKTEIVILSNDTKVPPDLIVYNANGLEVGMYRGCGDPNDPNFREKFIIYVEGFDPLFDNDVSDIYGHIANQNLVLLRNHGYTFMVVNWKNSTGDLMLNGNRLCKFLDWMKCNYVTGDVAEQFIVMGESLGGVIARYALRYMEVNPNFGNCKQSLMHNTRLFISYDSPHQGAYIPLAGQHAAGNINLRSINLTARLFTLGRLNLDFLYSPAAKQLLNLHVSSHYNYLDIRNANPLKAISTGVNVNSMHYYEHPRRTLFKGVLQAMGNDGYPEYCKKVAISNGLMSGDNQIYENDFFDRFTMQNGSPYFNGNMNIDATFLGVNVNIFSADYNLNAIDPGASTILYQSNYGKKYWKPKVKWKVYSKQFTINLIFWSRTFTMSIRIPDGIEIVQDYVTNKGKTEYSLGTYPWDNAPGGYFTAGDITDVVANRFRTNEWWNGNLKIGNFTFLGSSAGVTINTEADRFCFIPTVSALDMDLQPRDNILALSTASKMSKTPFDVIIGRGPHPSYPNNQYKSEEYSWNGFHTASMQNYVLDAAHNNGPNTPQNNNKTNYLLNMEIGNDWLFLENWEVGNQAIVSGTNHVMGGNDENPYFEYSSQPQLLWSQTNFYSFSTSNYIFSKSNPLVIPSNSGLTLRHGVGNFTDNGIIGVYSLIPHANAIVCNYPVDSFKVRAWEIEDEEFAVEEYGALKLYPNPFENELIIELPKTEQLEIEHWNYTISNVQGKIIKEGLLSAAEPKQNLNVADIEPVGIYFLKLSNGLSTFNYKLSKIK